MKIWNISQNNQCNPIHHTLKNQFKELVEEYGFDKETCKINIPTQIMRIFDKNYGLVVEFSQNDFINTSSYRGAQKLFKANRSEPQYLKRYWGKDVGVTNSYGFKIVDYDHSYNVLALNNTNNVGMKFINKILVPKMKVEFPAFPDRMFENDYSYEEHKENRGWLKIRNLTPQEKIILANKYGVEPFPNSLYENDRSSFQRRVLENELDTRLDGELSSLTDIRDYEPTENDSAFEIMEKTIREREESFTDSIKEGFDYGDFQDFSDIYTRTQSAYEDYELYPVRTNCVPKALKKRGKSPYSTKLGVIEWRYFNNYQKPESLDFWKKLKGVTVLSHKSPKYKWEMNEKEEIIDEYALPDNFWEEIEMAYQSR